MGADGHHCGDIDMATGMFSGGAAFGVFPQMQPRRRLQDPVGAANVPLDVTRGRFAGLAGLLPDALNFMGRSPMPTEMFGETQYEPTQQLPYGSEYFLQNLPLKPTSRIGEVAGQAGAFVPLNPMPAARAVAAGARALGPTAVGMGERYLQRQGLMPSVVPKNPNAPENIGKLAKIKNSPMVKLYHSSPYKNIDEVGFNAETQLERGDKRGIFFSTYPQEDYGEFVYEVLVPRKAITWDTLGGKKEKLTDAFVKPEYSNLIQFSKKEHGVENYLIDNAPSPYPQQTALDLAQQRAALPIEQGGLGLPAGNTAMDRAAASGLDVETNYIHSTNKPFSQVTDDGQFSGIFTLPNYSANYGSVDMPLMTSGKIATSQDLQNLIKKPTKKMQMAIDETIPLNLTDPADIADATVEMQKLRNQLARKYGFDGVRISDEFGNDTVALVNPDNIRSRFAAYDPFRRNAAIAAAMGVAAPNLMAGQSNEMPDAVRQYMADPRYSDPFADSIR